MGKRSRFHPKKALVLLIAGVWTTMLLASDYQFEVQLLRDSDVACGLKVHSNDVAVVDVQPLLSDKIEAVSQVHEHVPDHGLESPIPVLIEKAHLDGGTHRSALLRNAVRESAARGCDLLIVLDIAVEEKVMYRPQLLELKLPVSYVLVLFGSQVKNSAKPLDE